MHQVKQIWWMWSTSVHQHSHLICLVGLCSRDGCGPSSCPHFRGWRLRAPLLEPASRGSVSACTLMIHHCAKLTDGASTLSKRILCKGNKHQMIITGFTLDYHRPFPSVWTIPSPYMVQRYETTYSSSCFLSALVACALNICPYCVRGALHLFANAFCSVVLRRNTQD